MKLLDYTKKETHILVGLCIFLLILLIVFTFVHDDTLDTLEEVAEDRDEIVEQCTELAEECRALKDRCESVT
ncbi:hypothetical protein ACFL0V_02375 [Nanoarchaeota archaeon]